MDELKEVIKSLEKWHEVRRRLNASHERIDGTKSMLNMDTLPRAIKLLKDYEQRLTPSQECICDRFPIGSRMKSAVWYCPVHGSMEKSWE